MDDYELLDEPWLSVRLITGQVIEVGLLELYRRQAEIAALAYARPPAMVGAVRLLLAITHRALTFALADWRSKDLLSWYQDGLPAELVADYLEHWRHRFNLFDAEYPFMQVAALSTADETRDRFKPWTQIDLASASGDTPMVFDHACDQTPLPISPAAAISLLLGYQAFVPGGLVKVFRSSDRAGALANTAAVIPVGDRLWRTLCLNLHPPARALPVADLPCWERPALTVNDLAGPATLATGPNDRYTRQARAVLLRRETDGTICWLHFGAGQALEENPQAPDPMACYRVGSTDLVRLTFREGRALWRDLPALVPGGPTRGSKPPAVLEHAAGLRLAGSLSTPYQAVWIAGVASKQAKLLRWRIEQIVLPERLLVNDADVQDFLDFVQAAETLHLDLRKIAIRLIRDTLPQIRHEDREAAARLRFGSGHYDARFFTRIEQEVPRLMQLLQEGNLDEARRHWGAALRDAGRQLWAALMRGTGSTPVALRAQAQSERSFFGALKQLVLEFTDS